MNLEELQIKIGIELKELNKQLKKASDDINEYIGPKATKKMMSDNNKAIKRGLDEISRTTKYSMKKLHKDTTKEVDDMSKDINKSLVKAFDIDKTLVKFNKNIDSSMAQAKRSVRSACNDIRRELNAALNIKANIRVSASTSASRQSSGSGYETAAILASSQYTAAMIVKAINAMIDTNNKNTTRLENTMNKCTDKIIAAISKSGKTNEREQKPRRAKVIIPKEATTTTRGKLVGQPYGPDNRALIDALKNAYKTINILNRNLSALNNLKNIKQLGTGSYGSNNPQGGTVNWRQGRKGQTTSLFEGEVVNPITVSIPKEPFKQIQDIIEVINYKVKDFETGLVKVNSRAVSVAKTLNSLSLSKAGNQSLDSKTKSQPLKGEIVNPVITTIPKEPFEQIQDIITDINYTVKDFEEGLVKVNKRAESVSNTVKKLAQTNPLVPVPGKEGVLDTSQIDALKQVQKLKHKINNTPLMIESPVFITEEGIKNALAHFKTTFSNMASKMTPIFDEMMSKPMSETMSSSLNDLIKPIEEYIEKMKLLSASLKADFVVVDESIDVSETRKQLRELVKDYENLIKICKEEAFLRKTLAKSRGTKDTSKNNKRFSGSDIKDVLGLLSEDFDTTLSELGSIDTSYFEKTLSSLKDLVKPLEESLKKIKTISKALDMGIVDIDATDAIDARNQIEALTDSYEALIDACKSNNLNKVKELFGQAPVSSSSDGRQFPAPPPNKKGSGSSNKGGKPPKPTTLGFGFGAFKNEIDQLVELAKKAGAKIKKALSDSTDELAITIDDDDNNKISSFIENMKKVKDEVGETSSKTKSLSEILSDFSKEWDKLNDSFKNKKLNKAFDIDEKDFLAQKRSYVEIIQMLEDIQAKDRNNKLNMAFDIDIKDALVKEKELQEAMEETRRQAELRKWFMDNLRLNKAFDLDTDKFREKAKELVEEYHKWIGERNNKLNIGFEVDNEQVIESYDYFEKLKGNCIAARDILQSTIQGLREFNDFNFEDGPASGAGEKVKDLELLFVNANIKSLVDDLEELEKASGDLNLNFDDSSLQRMKKSLEEYLALSEKLISTFKAEKYLFEKGNSIGFIPALTMDRLQGELDAIENPINPKDVASTKFQSDQTNKRLQDKTEALEALYGPSAREKAKKENNYEARLKQLDKEFDDTLAKLRQLVEEGNSQADKESKINLNIDTKGFDKQLDEIEERLENFRKQIKKSMPDIKSHLKDSLDNVPDELALTIDDDESISKIAKIKKALSDALNPEVGPAKLDKWLESIENKVVKIAKKVKNAVVGIAIAIKDGIVSAFNFVVDQVKKVVNTIADLFKKLGKVISDTVKAISDFIVRHIKVIKAVVIGALASIVTVVVSSLNTIAGVVTGIVIGMTAMIIKNFDKVVKAVKKLGVVVANVAKKVKDWLVNAFSYVLDVIKDKINKLIEAIKKLGVAITNVAVKVKNTLVNAFKAVVDYVSDKFSKLINIIKKVASVMANVAKTIKNALVSAFVTVVDFISDKFNKLIGIIKKVASTIANVAKSIKNWLMIAFAHVLDVIEDKFNKLYNIIKKVGSAIVSVVKTVKNALVNAFNVAINFIKDKFNKLIAIIKKVGSAIANVAKIVKNALVNAFNIAVNYVVDKFNKLVSVVKRVMNAIANTITKVKNWIMIAFAHMVDVIEDKFNKLKNAITKVFQRIVALCKGYGAVIGKHIIKWFSPITNMIGKVVQSFKNLMLKLASLVKAGVTKIREQFNKLINSIVQGFNKAVNAVKTTIGNMISAIKTGFNKAVNAVKTSINNIASAIKNGFNKAVDSVKATMGRVSASIKNGFGKAKGYASGAINQISSGFGKIANSTKTAMSKVVSTVKNNATKAKHYIGGIFTSIKSSQVIGSIKSTMSKVSSAVKSGISKIKGSMSKVTGVLNLGNIGKSVGQVKSTVTRMVPSINKGFDKIKNSSRKAFNSLSANAKKALATIVVASTIKFNSMRMGIKNTMAKISANVSRYSAKIKSTLNKAFTTVRTSKLYTSVAKGLNKAKAAVSKFAGKVKPILNKAFTGIKVGTKVAGTISKGLGKALGALRKFASGCKTIWGKIRGIFHKGAGDASKATGKLTAGLKGLLAKALGFFSLYGLINLGKQAITQSQTLAQAESKLTSLMRQRMGATNDTVKAIRNLAAEQAKAGVVSETAMVRGAEQLSMYVHSARALRELIPAIANMTARRGGLFATEDDAEEVATQLGEAIREGTTTPLEQSGIYLSEAEIKKFQEFRTEEQRAAYLADVIAENIGDINKQLAQTPHGQIAQLKNNFKSLLGTLGTLLVNVIQPIVKWLNVLVVAANNALKALGELLGFDMTGGGLAGLGDIGTGSTGGVDNATESLEEAKDAAGEAEEAVEKFKGSLMGFDEINILSDNSDKKEDDPTNITPGVGGQLDPGEYLPTEMTEGENIFTKFGEKMKAFIDEVLEPFKNAWDLLGDRWKTAWADLKDSFKNFCDSLASFLKSVWDNGGKEFVQHLAEIGLACGIAAMEIGGTILDALAKLWDHLDPEKNMHTQRLLDVLNEVFPKLRDFILGLNEHLENLLEYGGQDVLNAMGDCFMDLAAAAVNSFGVIIDAVDGLIDHLDPKFNQDTRNMLQAVADAFHATGQAAWDFSELLRSTLENGGQEVINAFGTFGVNLIETAARVTTTVMESFSELFDYIDPANNSNTRQALKNWEDAFYSLGDAALEFADLFESVMDNGGQEVVNKLGDAFVSLGGLVGTAVKEIGDALDGLYEHLDPATNQFTKDFLSAWERAFAGVSDMFNSFGDLLGSVMDNGGQELLNSIGDLGMKLGEAAGVIVEEVSETLSGLFEHLDPSTNPHTKKMLESLDGLVDSITKFVDSCIKAFQKFMDNGGREFVNNLGDILAIVIDLAAELGSGIIDIITAFMDSWVGQALIEGVATALEWVSEKLVGLADTFEVVKDIFKNIIDIIVGIFEGDGEKVGRAFANLIKNAFKLTGELLQWLWDIGCDIVAGLVKGICALPELLWEAVKFIFDTIVGFFKELFGIHSPSTVFAELGGFLIEGLVEGITGLISSVTDAFKKIGDAITGAIEGIIKNGVEKFKEIKDGIVEKCKETKEAVSEKWKEIKTTVSDKCKEIYDDTKEKWKNVYETVSEKAKDTYETAKENWKNIYEAVSEKTKETYESIKENWKEIKQTATDIFSETYNTTKEKWKNIKDTVSEKAKETYESAKDRWSDLKQNTTDRFKEAYETVRDKFGNIRDTVKDKASQAYEDASASWTKIKDDAASKLEQIKTDAEKRYNDVKEILVKKIGEAKDGIVKKWEEVRTATNECVENVRQTAEEKYNEIKETIKSRLEDVKNETSKKWEEIKNNTSTSVENIRKEAEERYAKIKESLTSTLETTKTTMATKWDAIKSDAISKASKMTDEATTKFADIKSKFTSKLDEVKTALSSKWDNLESQASKGGSNIASNFQKGIGNLSSNASKALEEAQKTVSSKLTSIGNLFKNISWKIPKIKLSLPKISISGSFSINPPSVPKFSLNWEEHARGGIIDGITPLGMTGNTMHIGGEAGKEMVVPLENTSFTSKIAQAMGQAVDNALARSNNRTNNSGNPYINDNRDVVLQVDGREFARASINSINKLQRESGRTLLDI